jgi:phage tail sheath protein FI
LNALRINTIRTLPGTGPVVWGARVLGTDPEWKYIPTRRTAILLEQSIGRGLRWATFEPNTDELWGRVRGRVEELMLMLFRSGAFPGATPQQAFVVRCDRSTMTQADIDAGVLRVLVGFAALRPGEFTMLQVTLAVGLPG